MRARTISRRRRIRRTSAVLAALLVLVLMATLVMAAGCDSGGTEAGVTTSSTLSEGRKSGNIEGEVGDSIALADTLITVKALEATFQPAQPVQRLSAETPSAPEAGESFYQAYVRVENRGETPVRVDPTHFACLVGKMVVPIEPTRSGPPARSLLKNTSFDLILTFKSEAGYQPVLLYSPSWYQGTVMVSPTVDEGMGGESS